MYRDLASKDRNFKKNTISLRKNIFSWTTNWWISDFQQQTIRDSTNQIGLTWTVICWSKGGLLQQNSFLPAKQWDLNSKHCDSTIFTKHWDSTKKVIYEDQRFIGGRTLMNWCMMVTSTRTPISRWRVNSYLMIT